MLNKIGVKNFRVFKEYNEFEIRPITLLTGPNNSGKSSFTKLLLLLKNGIEKLNFDFGLHNLENFDKVLNWEINDKVLKLRLANRLPILDDSFFVNYFYVSANLTQVTIANMEVDLLLFRVSEHDRILNININYLIDLIYDNKITEEINFAPSEYIKQYLSGSSIIPKNDPDLDKKITFENFEEIFKTHRYHDNLQGTFIGNIVLKNEIDKLEKNYLLYDIIINGKNASIYHAEDLIKLQEIEFSNIFFDGYYGMSGIPDDFIESMEYCLHRANEIVKEKFINHFKELLPNDIIEINETPLGKLLFEIKLFDSSNNFSLSSLTRTNYQKTFIEQFAKFSNGLKYEFNSLEFISANRGSQKRVLKNNSENDIDRIVVDFFKKSDKNIDFLLEILEILEIQGELTVERFENVISVVYLNLDNRKVALSDLGYGFSQIIPIVLKLATVTNSIGDEINFVTPNSTIIIEEPEANLHPNLQSKLADVFVTTLKHYPKLNFIIETHSEYFIRKLQYLTAKKEFSTSDSVIYYFNAEKHVTPNEPKVKKIEITEIGNLTDSFGPGFFDETTRLQFGLLKLNQPQNN